MNLVRRVNVVFLIAVFSALLFVAVTGQEPEHRDDKYKDDPHAFCYKGPEEPPAHACACLMVCGPDVNGDPVQQETTACAMYCSKQRCTCHADETCDQPEVL